MFYLLFMFLCTANVCAESPKPKVGNISSEKSSDYDEEKPRNFQEAYQNAIKKGKIKNARDIRLNQDALLIFDTYVAEVADHIFFDLAGPLYFLFAFPMAEWFWWLGGFLSLSIGFVSPIVGISISIGCFSIFVTGVGLRTRSLDLAKMHASNQPIFDDVFYIKK